MVAFDVSKAASLPSLPLLPVTSLWTLVLMDALGDSNACSASGGDVDHVSGEGAGGVDCACGRVGSGVDHLWGRGRGGADCL